MAVSRQTYEMFAKRYGIKYKRKSMQELSKQIKEYEKKHKIKNGLYY